LATFAAGFIVRPFGALVFGRIGDLIGRKYTFLLTLLIMGGSTFAIGLIPGYATIGYFAPILVLLLRLLQGLALGGEYGGAATYVAEHAPAGKKGYYTSFIQTTASMGLFFSLGVILISRFLMGVEAFNEWGWRIPFLISALLVAISFFIRSRMKESPLFEKIKAEGKVSKQPLKDSFGKKENLKLVLLALFGATAGQGVIWYTGQFYALSFIQKSMNIEFIQSNMAIAIGVLIATPFFIVFGAWSDKIGRKKIMLAGMLLGILLYMPIYKNMYALSDLSAKTEIEGFGTINKQISIPTKTSTKTITHILTDGTQWNEIIKQNIEDESIPPVVSKEITLAQKEFWLLILFITIQVLFVTMVYGPIAAFLVELFPTRIRYTSMSLPYHIGNGVFGGLTPFIATSLTSLPGATPFDGLWYPIGVASVCFVIGLVYINKTHQQGVN